MVFKFSILIANIYKIFEVLRWRSMDETSSYLFRLHFLQNTKKFDMMSVYILNCVKKKKENLAKYFDNV